MVFSQKCTVFSDAVDLTGKTVTLRADLDLPLVESESKGGGFEVDLGDDVNLERFNATVESIRSMFEVQDVQNLLILAHNGIPGGKIDPSLSLKPFAALLEAELDMPVRFINSVIGEAAAEALAALRAPRDEESEEEPPDKQIILFENLRFHPEELTSMETEYLRYHPDSFAMKLSDMADAFVNDCLSECLSLAPSIIGVRPLEGTGLRLAGPSLQAALQACSNVLENPMKPLTAIIGGSVCEQSVKLLRNLVTVADNVLLAGEMAHALESVRKGQEIVVPLKAGEDSDKREELKLQLVILNRDAMRYNCTLLTPVDYVFGDKDPAVEEGEDYTGEIGTGSHADVSSGDNFILDIGAETADMYSSVIRRSQTLAWHGALGLCQFPDLQEGTSVILDAMADSDEMFSIATHPTTARHAANIAALEGNPPPFTSTFTNGVVASILGGDVALGISLLSSVSALESEDEESEDPEVEEEEVDDEEEA